NINFYCTKIAIGYPKLIDSYVAAMDIIMFSQLISRAIPYYQNYYFQNFYNDPLYVQRKAVPRDRFTLAYYTVKIAATDGLVDFLKDPWYEGGFDWGDDWAINLEEFVETSLDIFETNFDIEFDVIEVSEFPTDFTSHHDVMQDAYGRIWNKNDSTQNKYDILLIYLTDRIAAGDSSFYDGYYAIAASFLHPWSAPVVPWNIVGCRDVLLHEFSHIFSFRNQNGDIIEKMHDANGNVEIDWYSEASNPHHPPYYYFLANDSDYPIIYSLMDYLDCYIIGNDRPDWDDHNYETILVNRDWGMANDPDDDGLTNAEELIYDTLPYNNDTDDDGMPDGWEIAYYLNPLINDANEDPDGDTLSNLGEWQKNRNPLSPDWGSGIFDVAASYIYFTPNSPLKGEILWTDLVFDVNVEGGLRIEIRVRHTPFGSNPDPNGWITQVDEIDWYEPGSYERVDAVWATIEDDEFCMVEVEWYIWTGAVILDFGSDIPYNNLPSAMVEASSLIYSSGEIACTTMDFTIYTAGYYQIVIEYRTKDYGSSVWHSSIVVFDSDRTYFSTGLKSITDIILFTEYNRFDTIEVTWYIFTAPSMDDPLLIDSLSKQYIAAIPSASISSDAYLSQGYDDDWNSQDLKSYFWFDIGTSGTYEFSIMWRESGGSWWYRRDHEAHSYDIGLNHLYDLLYSSAKFGYMYTVVWSVHVRGILIDTETKYLTMDKPAYVHSGSYIYQDNDDIVWSVMKLYLRTSGTYKISIEYKRPGDNTWTIDNIYNKKSMSWSSSGTKTITEALFIPLQNGVCYVRWSIYDKLGSHLYSQHTESLYVYKWSPGFP
ncbi:MAG: hypothetical protein ACFE9A_21335, partial [Candidatus Hodarchaeota archaeon]